MIDWSIYKFNQELSMTIVDDNIKYDLTVKLIEYEYSLHRHPVIADVKIIESTDVDMFPIQGVMRLPMVTKDSINFLLYAPTDMAPARELQRKGSIKLN
jgi:hypothetical protein